MVWEKNGHGPSCETAGKSPGLRQIFAATPRNATQLRIKESLDFFLLLSVELRCAARVVAYAQREVVPPSPSCIRPPTQCPYFPIGDPYVLRGAYDHTNLPTSSREPTPAREPTPGDAPQPPKRFRWIILWFQCPKQVSVPLWISVPSHAFSALRISVPRQGFSALC